MIGHSKALVKRSAFDKAFDYTNTAFMVLVCFLTLYPVWYFLIHSFNDGLDLVNGEFFWLPRVFSLSNYRTVFIDKAIVTAFGVTTARTLIATPLAMLFTAMVAYGLTKKDLVFRKFYMTIGIITMFFGGGLIPSFILIKNLGLYNNFLVYIIPAMFNFYNLILFQAFFREIPPSLEESARIDGASDPLIFFKIILPLSKPVLATLALFTGVYHWNDYFVGVMFIINSDLLPVQTFLYKVIAETSSHQIISNAAVDIGTRGVTTASLQYATMIVTTLPIICVYPFLQKYFVKGLLLGAVKG